MQDSSTSTTPKGLQNPDVIGKPLDRIDGRSKVTGDAKYAADFFVPRLAHAVLFGSTIARGRVKSIDTTDAAKQPGILAIITRENCPKLHRVSMDHEQGKPGQTYLPLQDDEVHYAGQYLGIVVAETFTAARDAARRVKVTYDHQDKPVVELDEALDKSFAPRKMGRGEKPSAERGKPDDALASAALKIDQTYITPIENHNPMELSGTIASWDENDKLLLHDATQFVFGVRAVVSTWLGISDDSVRVIDPFLGGGFGCKGSVWPHVVLAAVAAKQVKRPVKLVLTRQQMFFGVGYRPKTIQRVALGSDQQGKLASLIHECTSQTSMWKDEWVETSTRQSRMLYSCPNVRTTQKLGPVNANTPTQMRAPGHATGTFALEVAMDELAYASGIDPLELRLRNYAEKDEGENEGKGLPFSSKALRACYEQAAARFGWEKRNPKVGATRDGKWLVGWGMATATYPTNQSEANATVKLSADGGASVMTAAHDLGTGAYTVLAQIAAEVTGVPVERVKVEIADTQLPESPVAGGSQTTASAGSAVLKAAEKAVAMLKERATADPQGPLYQMQSKEISVGGGRVFATSDKSKGETIEALLKRNGSKSIEAKGSAAPPAKPTGSEENAGATQNIEKYSKHAWGAQFVEVRIDPRLGECRVSRAVGAFAAGRIINAKTAHSQIMGGMVWGISAALLEHTIYDPRTAKVVNDNLADYLVPVNPDVREIDCFFVDEPDTQVNPLGAKGIGELGITGVAAAISNAAYHATGKRLRELPITSEKLMM